MPAPHDHQDPPDYDDATTNEWRRILTGEDPYLRRLRRMWHWLPASPRCKMCAAPFRGAGRLLTRVVMHGNSAANPLLCNLCFSGLRQHPGGAEIDTTILFADIRGSTGIAERTSAASFSRLVQHFYVAAARAIEDNGGIVDKFLGDGVMALFIPVIAGENHAGRSIAAARAVLSASEAPDLLAGGVRVGVGVHTGQAFVGAVGTHDRLDFSALGDTVNVAARLGAVAGPGQAVISEMAWSAAGMANAAAERRTIEVQGRTAQLEIVVLHSASSAAGTPV